MGTIAGVWHRQHGDSVRGSAQAQVDGMLRSMRDRLADTNESWGLAQIALGYRSPLDMNDFAHQEGTPARVAVLDGYLHNRDALCAELGISAQTASDGAILLAAYARWGFDCASRILGEFAFIIWDAALSLCFCARDPFGARPFYYVLHPGLFAFASEIKALLTLPSALSRARFNEARIFAFFVEDFSDQESTFFEGVQRLKPGHTLIVREGNAQLSPFWQLNPDYRLAPMSDEAYEAEFRHLFLEAVAARLGSRSPVGIALSGGLDSSSLACAADYVLAERGVVPGERLRAYSVLYSPTVSGFSEAAYVQAVVTQKQIASTVIDGEATRHSLFVPDVIAIMDDLYVSMGYSVLWKALQAAQRDGIRVLLDGTDGDTVVTYDPVYLTELAGQFRWLTGLREARAYARRFYLGRVSAWSLVRRHMIQPYVSGALSLLRARLLRGSDPRPQDAVPRLLNRDFARRVDAAERLSARWQGRRQHRRVRESHYAALMHGSSHGLEYLDLLASRFGIEPRYPYFDTRLVTYSYGLPREQRVRDGWNRRIVRRALSDLLPLEIAQRSSKWIPTKNHNHILLNYELDFIKNSLYSVSNNNLSAYLDTNYIQHLFRQFESTGDAGIGLSLWSVSLFALWLNKWQAFSG
ncbi:MAG: hypothetical protein JNL42_00025 [Anaerolineae bacterium]|nr:hypothetical protein [Anaerolineae bacterium]